MRKDRGGLYLATSRIEKQSKHLPFLNEKVKEDSSPAPPRSNHRKAIWESSENLRKPRKRQGGRGKKSSPAVCEREEREKSTQKIEGVEGNLRGEGGDQTVLTGFRLLTERETARGDEIGKVVRRGIQNSG